jgi:putative FmdB family regulatory protein
MGWKYFDFKCPECGHVFESMEKSAGDPVDCTECGARAEYLPSANLGWSNDQATRKDMLRKRSEAHTKSEQKKGNMQSPRDLPKL